MQTSFGKQDEWSHDGRNYKIKKISTTSSVLDVWNLSWKDTGLYVCLDENTNEMKEVAIFVPGKAWFTLDLPSVTYFKDSVGFASWTHYSIPFTKQIKWWLLFV